MLIKLLFNLIVVMALTSCSSNEAPSTQTTPNTGQTSIQFEKKHEVVSQIKSVLIEESDAEESISDDSQPIILAQANINQNNNWEYNESQHFMRLIPI